MLRSKQTYSQGGLKLSAVPAKCFRKKLARKIKSYISKQHLNSDNALHLMLRTHTFTSSKMISIAVSKRRAAKNRVMPPVLPYNSNIAASDFEKRNTQKDHPKNVWRKPETHTSI